MAIIMLCQPLQLHATLRQTKLPMIVVLYSLMQPVGSSLSWKPKFRSSPSSRAETSLCKEGKVQYVPPGFAGFAGFDGLFLRAVVGGVVWLGPCLMVSLRGDGFVIEEGPNLTLSLAALERSMRAFDCANIVKLIEWGTWAGKIQKCDVLRFGLLHATFVSRKSTMGWHCLENSCAVDT